MKKEKKAPQRKRGAISNATSGAFEKAEILCISLPREIAFCIGPLPSCSIVGLGMLREASKRMKRGSCSHEPNGVNA